MGHVGARVRVAPGCYSLIPPATEGTHTNDPGAPVLARIRGKCKRARSGGMRSKRDALLHPRKVGIKTRDNTMLPRRGRRRFPPRAPGLPRERGRLSIRETTSRSLSIRHQQRPFRPARWEAAEANGARRGPRGQDKRAHRRTHLAFLRRRAALGVRPAERETAERNRKEDEGRRWWLRRKRGGRNLREGPGVGEANKLCLTRQQLLDYLFNNKRSRELGPDGASSAPRHRASLLAKVFNHEDS